MLSILRAPLAIIGIAVQSSSQHPLRTGLSALAVGAAVTTIAVVVTALNGVEEFARVTSARAFGSDTFVVAQVFPAQLSRRELALRLERNPAIRRSDYRFLDRYAGGDVRYAPIAQTRADVVAGARKFEGASLNGTESQMLNIRDLGLSAGRFFLDQESRRGRAVAVLGADVADELFADRDPLGRTVRIAGRAFRVVGLQARQGTAAGVSLDRYVWIPLRAFERAFGAPPSLQVFARASDLQQPELAEDRARTTLRARRQLRPGRQDNFDVLTPEAARGFVLRLASQVGLAAGPISAMALLAAVVVVANTSLVSVTQQTREIGIRRAVGARRARIMAEVVAESTMIAVAGGVAGLLLAAALVRAAAEVAAMQLAVEPRTVVMSLAAAAISGLVAGLYPARRAAAIQVVEALRSE